jgi:hypothetical protein
MYGKTGTYAEGCFGLRRDRVVSLPMLPFRRANVSGCEGAE